MPTKAALVSTLMWCLIQVGHIPCVFGSDGKSSSAVSSLLVQIMVKTTSFRQDPNECDETLPFVQVNLTAAAADGLVAKWAPVQKPCKNIASYVVTFSEVGGTVETRNITERTIFLFPGLNASTAYQVVVQPLDGSGQAVGKAGTAGQTTLDASPGECPFPALMVFAGSHPEAGNYILCAVVDKPGAGTPYEGTIGCRSIHPNIPAPTLILTGLYYGTPELQPFEDLQEHLRSLEYTEELLVQGYYEDGIWFSDYDVLDPALMIGVQEGGSGPDDYMMLYLDPTKDFGYSAAKRGHGFGGMICRYPILT